MALPAHVPGALNSGRKPRPEAKEAVPGAGVSGLSSVRFRRTATLGGSREVGHRAQVPDQQESAYLFSPFLLLKQALKKLELKSIGHRQRGGG